MFEDLVDVKGTIAKQALQLHQGMILTDKDAKTLESNTKFKSVELNENFVNVDTQDDREQSSIRQDSTLDDGRPVSPEELQISLFEAKKLNESHMVTIKEQRKALKFREAQQFRQEKQAI